MKRLLLVDSDSATHHIFQEILHDWIVLPASSAEEMEERLAEEKGKAADLVVMIDIGILREQDLDWIGRIRSDYPATPLLMLSPNAEDAMLETAFAAGVHGVLVRPFYVKDLLALLGKWA